MRWDRIVRMIEVTGKSEGKGGERPRALSDEELEARCRLTEVDIAAVDEVISHGKRGSVARLHAIGFKAKFGNAKPKGTIPPPPAASAGKRATAYVVEAPTGYTVKAVTVGDDGVVVPSFEPIKAGPEPVSTPKVYQVEKPEPDPKP